MIGAIHNVTEHDGWAWMWWTYGGADTRYITSDKTIAGVEFMAGFSGPLELLGWYLYFWGKNNFSGSNPFKSHGFPGFCPGIAN